MKLKEHHLNRGTLDLHYLDHQSAQLLIEHVLKDTQQIKKIIIGCGKHSKSAHTKSMQKLLIEALKKYEIEEKVIFGIGYVTFNNSSNTYENKNRFFLNDKPLNPNAKEFVPTKKY